MTLTRSWCLGLSVSSSHPLRHPPTLCVILVPSVTSSHPLCHPPTLCVILPSPLGGRGSGVLSLTVSVPLPLTDTFRPPVPVGPGHSSLPRGPRVGGHWSQPPIVIAYHVGFTPVLQTFLTVSWSPKYFSVNPSVPSPLPPPTRPHPCVTDVPRAKEEGLGTRGRDTESEGRSSRVKESRDPGTPETKRSTGRHY